MRLLNRPMAFLLAAALAAAAVFVIIEVIALAVGAKPVVFGWTSWYRWAERTHWNALVVKVWSIIVGVVGLILLVLELKPRRTSRIALDSDDPATDAAMTRKGLAGAARAAATDIDGISTAAATVTRRTVTVAARAAAIDKAAAEALIDPVTHAVQSKLDSLGLHSAPRVRVRVSAKGT